MPRIRSVAVIQVGENNMYGHPAQETLDKLEARGILIYRTDQCGAIGLDISGSKFKIETVLNP